MKIISGMTKKRGEGETTEKKHEARRNTKREEGEEKKRGRGGNLYVYQRVEHR